MVDVDDEEDVEGDDVEMALFGGAPPMTFLAMWTFGRSGIAFKRYVGIDVCGWVM